MIFRTTLPVKKSSWNITHEDFILSLGSCFADCMSERLEQNQFKVSGNPFGIIYNPLSIVQNLISSVSETLPDENLYAINGKTYHYNFHSEIFGENKDDLSVKIETINKSISKSLKSANYLIITLGTAFIYLLKKGDIPVANCHKMPAQLFYKKMLSVEEIILHFGKLLSFLTVDNPDAKIILTVSPVRHIKDTLELNAVSKSVLKLASWQLSEKYPDRIAYFPSCEIMMDDLRDYRFYKEDMIHPTKQAENYIWEHFCETFFDKNTIEINKEIAEIFFALGHRPFHPDSVQHQEFLLKTMDKAKKLNDKVAVKSLLEKVALKLGL